MKKTEKIFYLSRAWITNIQYVKSKKNVIRILYANNKKGRPEGGLPLSHRYKFHNKALSNYVHTKKKKEKKNDE